MTPAVVTVQSGAPSVRLAVGDVGTVQASGLSISGPRADSLGVKVGTEETV